MKVAIALCLLVAVGFACAGVVVPATTLVRTPSLDSAVIKSDRIGGNFAYSTVEGHAYAAVSPVVQRVVAPVGVSYTAHQVPLGYDITPIATPVAAYPQIWGGVLAHQPSFIGQQILANPAINLGNPILSGLPVAEQVVPVKEPSLVSAPVGPAVSSDSVINDDDTVSIESA